MAATRDFGEGIFGIASALLPHSSLMLPFLVQILFSLAVIGTLVVQRRQIEHDNPRWWALLLLAIALVNPRLMPYDSVIALVPALYFLLRCTGSAVRFMTALGVSAVCFALDHHAGIKPLLLAGFLLGTRVLADRVPNQLYPLLA